jgi:hypothetical protein
MSVLHSYYEYGPMFQMVNKECLLKKTLLSYNFSGFKDFKITEMLNAVVSSRIQLHRGSIMHPQEKYEDTKGVICSSKYSCQNKKGQTTIR